MRLAYSIAGKIAWIHDFLDKDMYKGIYRAIIKERKNINLHTVEGVWSEDLIRHIAAPQRVQVNNYQPFEELKEMIKSQPYLPLPELEHMSTNIHYMTKDTGIQWHNDSKWKYAATLYLNHRWNRNWGGEFMFMDGAGAGFIPILSNSMVIVKSPLEHKVNQVCSPIMPRISIQIFMK